MKKNPISVALRAKGALNFYHRSLSIVKRYGFNEKKMDQALHIFFDVLQRFNCGATFPITAMALKRHINTITKYHNQNIEFAVHGFTHIDYARLEPEEQLNHLKLAREVFNELGITPVGFRSPYLSYDKNLSTALRTAGFSYVSNQPILWSVLDNDIFSSKSSSSYERGIAFYSPWKASERLSLPMLENQLIQIPVSLPDDEILIDRLDATCDLVKETWLTILHQTYQRGELFTLQLHPERISFCEDALKKVLTEASELNPPVWCARLDEIADWWKSRAVANVDISIIESGKYHCVVTGPEGTIMLARGIEVNAPSTPWLDGYKRVDAMQFTFHAPCLPLIGVSPSTPWELTSFLRQQGYIIEISKEKELYLNYIDRESFKASEELTILTQIERSGSPLIRLGRWPNGAKSALAITGDIDAMTLWDYAFRIIGR